MCGFYDSVLMPAAYKRHALCGLGRNHLQRCVLLLLSIFSRSKTDMTARKPATTHSFFPIRVGQVLSGCLGWSMSTPGTCDTPKHRIITFKDGVQDIPPYIPHTFLSQHWGWKPTAESVSPFPPCVHRCERRWTRHRLLGLVLSLKNKISHGHYFLLKHLALWFRRLRKEESFRSLADECIYGGVWFLFGFLHR